MRDLQYPLAASDPNESLVYLNIRIVGDGRDLRSSHCLISLGESTLRGKVGATRPFSGISSRGKLPFFVTNYLEKGPDDNYHDACSIDGNTALHQTMKYSGYTRIITLKLLLQKGIDVNSQDILGNTALHLAVNSSRSLIEPVVGLLLAYNIDVNIRNEKGYTALHLASKRGQETITRELLNKRTEVNTKTNSGRTALHIATKYGYESIVKMLLENGASINAQDLKGLSALHIAAGLENHIVIVRLLLGNGADVNLQDNYGKTALHTVVCSNDKARIEALLENGARSDIPDHNGNTARAFDIHYHFETLRFEAERRKNAWGRYPYQLQPSVSRSLKPLATRQL